MNDDGAKKYYHTELYLLPSDWNGNASKVRSSHPMHKLYNQKIKQLHMELERHFLKGGTHESWVREVNGPQAKSLIAYLEKLKNQIMASKVSGIKPATGKNYGSWMAMA